MYANISKEYNTNFVRDILPLRERDIQTVLRGIWLNDIHIDHFGLLMKLCSEYRPRETCKVQCPDRIKPVSNNQKHIQILHSCDDIMTNKNGHWVCSYYDTKMIYIYDSLNLKQLHVHHKIYLEKLFPFYSFNEQSYCFRDNPMRVIVAFLQSHLQCHFYIVFNQIQLYMTKV